jgi:hypothetical protein
VDNPQHKRRIPMSIRKFEAFDSKTQMGATLEIEGETAPSAATLTLLFSQLKSAVEAEIAGIEEEEAPEVSDSMSQKEFEAVRAAMEAKKRKKRDTVDVTDVRVSAANRKRNSPEETLKNLRNRMKSQRA